MLKLLHLTAINHVESESCKKYTYYLLNGRLPTLPTVTFLAAKP